MAQLSLAMLRECGYHSEGKACLTPRDCILWKTNREGGREVSLELGEALLTAFGMLLSYLVAPCGF